MLWPKSSRFDQGRYLNRIPCRRTLRAMNLADLVRETELQGDSDVWHFFEKLTELQQVPTMRLTHLFLYNLYIFYVGLLLYFQPLLGPL